MRAQFKNFKVLGITRDFNVCDCCGKENLIRTVAILDVTYGVVSHFGTTCAASIDKYDTLEAAKLAKKDIQAEVRKFDDKEKQAGTFAYGSLRRELKAAGISMNWECEAFLTACKFRKEEILNQWILDEQKREFYKNNPEVVTKEAAEQKQRWDNLRASRVA